VSDLGLMTTIDLPKSCVLQDKEIELICNALSHTFKVDGNIFTVKEACKISNEGGLLKESKCGCPLHLKISVNCTDVFSVFLVHFLSCFLFYFRGPLVLAPGYGTTVPLLNGQF